MNSPARISIRSASVPGSTNDADPEIVAFFRGILKSSFPEEYERLDLEGKLEEELVRIFSACQSIVADYNMEMDLNNPYFLYRVIEEIYCHFLKP